MKQFIFLLVLLFTSICFPQNYVEKQSLYHSNELQNAGFENNKLYWSISASSTAVIVSGSNALDGILSLGFTPTASGQTITSNLVDLKCTDLCQASVWYKTSEATNLPVLEVLNSSNSVIATKSLSTTSTASQAAVTFNPVTQAKIRIRSSGSAVVTYLDKFKLGDREILNTADIVLSLGYTPASSSAVDINTNNIATVSSTMLRKANNLSDVASATVARTNLGLGSLATKNTATLSSSDVSGTLPVANGGTGFSTYSTGDILVASGSSLTKLPIGADGKVLTVSSTAVGGVVWGEVGLAPASPVGSVIMFAGTSCPTGYLYGNGAAVSRSTYASLFSAIGTIWGYGDNSTTFNLPDFRGLFVRGMDDNANRDPDKAARTALATGGATGNNVGSYQSHEFNSHTHPTGGFAISVPGAGPNQVVLNGSGGYATGARGGNETRPINVYVIYCVKY